MSSAPPYKNRHSSKRFKLFKPEVFLISIVIILIVGLAALVSLNKWHKDSQKKPKTSNSSSLVHPTTSASSSATLTQYTATGSDLNLSFSYPAGWTVSPASNSDNNNQMVTLSSPVESILNAGGQTVSGKVTITIRPQSATISELSSNNPTAAQTSTQIAYSAPTANQYQYPYITFINFKSESSNATQFEEAIITGPNMFSQGSALSADDLTGLDPIISAMFSKCLKQSCSGSGATPLSITSDIWQSSPAFTQVLNVFQSLKLN